MVIAFTRPTRLMPTISSPRTVIDGGQAGVGGDRVALLDVTLDRGGLITGGGQRVLHTCGDAVDRGVVLRARADPVAVDLARRVQRSLQGPERQVDRGALVLLVDTDAEHS
jgi:hypothetical protein